MVTGSHVLRTDVGAFFVDRRPDPRVVLAQTAGNYILLRAPQVITARDIQPHIKGFAAAPRSFLSVLPKAFPGMKVWPRNVMVRLPHPDWLPGGRSVQLLGAGEIRSLNRLEPDLSWIDKTWGGSSGLAERG